MEGKLVPGDRHPPGGCLPLPPEGAPLQLFKVGGMDCQLSLWGTGNSMEQQCGAIPLF